MTALLYLRRDGRDYASGAERLTPASASKLIAPFRYAAVSRFDGSLVASDSCDQVARYGKPRFGADLAQEVFDPDWYHTACGEAGTGNGTCGCGTEADQ